MKRYSVLGGLVSWVLVVSGMGVCSAASAKTPIKGEGDLPRFSYPISGSASALVDADDATFAAFMSKVRTDLDGVLNKYDIQDRAAERDLLTEKFELQELAGEYQDALGTVAAANALEDKPAARLTGELFATARLQAAIDAGRAGGAAYGQAFTRHYRTAIESLPWDTVRDEVRSQYASTRLATPALVLGSVRMEIDPAASKSGAVDNDEAAEIIDARVSLKRVLPLADERGSVLHTYIAAHNIPKPDIWVAREVTLHADQHLTAVRVAIWDSGIDPQDFPQQMSTDEEPTASGTHGLAFDDQGHVSRDWLHPLTQAELQAYPETLEVMAGVSDLQEGIDSPVAEATVKKLHAFSVEQMHQLYADFNVVSQYVHGTHCAGIAARGNPAARLVVARFNDELPYLPFAPTAEWVRRMGAAFAQMGDYFRTRNVRVVNMSWGDEPQEFEQWLSKTGGGADPAARKRLAAQLFALWRSSIESAMKSAPGTLFVVAAGNSNNNPRFIDDVPTSLKLPNMIVVGAVNQAGDETSFTSYGEMVVVHADGYNVESTVPGQKRLKLSGTSMASPNVVNLAAKLFALDPSLTPKDVIALIRDGARTSADGRRHLIDERRSVELLQEHQVH
jgi:subtilisin family serine protease